MFESWMLNILARLQRGERITPAQMLITAPEHLLPHRTRRLARSIRHLHIVRWYGRRQGRPLYRHQMRSLLCTVRSNLFAR